MSFMLLFTFIASNINHLALSTSKHFTLRMNFEGLKVYYSEDEMLMVRFYRKRGIVASVLYLLDGL